MIVSRYNRKTEEIEWVVGGADGTLDIINFEGVTLPKNSTVFYGQHNLEVGPYGIQLDLYSWTFTL